MNRRAREARSRWLRSKECERWRESKKASGNWIKRKRRRKSKSKASRKAGDTPKKKRYKTPEPDEAMLPTESQLSVLEKMGLLECWSYFKHRCMENRLLPHYSSPGAFMVIGGLRPVIYYTKTQKHFARGFRSVDFGVDAAIKAATAESEMR